MILLLLIHELLLLPLLVGVLCVELVLLCSTKCLWLIDHCNASTRFLLINQNMHLRGAFINCGTGVLQGSLLDLPIFNAFQLRDVVSFDRNSVSSLQIHTLYADR